MAPEQADNPLAVDHRADIYSLGVVLYEMLTGQLPLGRFPLPSQQVPLDARLDQIVLRALESEPARRYQQATEIKSDLETLSIASPVSSAPRLPPSTATYPVVPPAVPFEIHGIYWRLARIHGLMHLVDHFLVLEYHVRLLGLVILRAREERIPLVNLQSLNLTKRWWKTELVLRAYRLSTLANIPGSHQGQLTCELQRSDRKLAEDFVALAKPRLGGGTLVAAAGPPKPGVLAPVGRRLRSLVLEVRSLMFMSRAKNPAPSESPTIIPGKADLAATDRPQRDDSA
jgi:hypothetical protein